MNGVQIHSLLKWSAALLVGLGLATVLRLTGVQQDWILVAVSILGAVCSGLWMDARGLGNSNRQSPSYTLSGNRWRLEGSTVGEWEFDCQTGNVHCSSVLCSMLDLDYDRYSFSKDEFCDRIFSEDRGDFEATLAEVLKLGTTQSVDCRIGKIAGTERWVEVVMSPLRLRGSVVSVSGIFVGIGDRKFAEAQLIAERASLEAVLENTDDVILSVDKDLCITASNTTYKVIMKAAYGEKVEVGDYLFEYTDDELEKLWLPRYQKALLGEEVRVEDVFYVRGKPFVFDVSLKPIRSGGKVNGIAVYSRHITEQKQREAEWLAAKEKAEESDQLKSAFLANMSHEIRTPLNAIMGFAQLLKEESLSREERDRFLDIVLSNGNHLLRILGDIMDLAQIESNQLRLENERFDIGFVLKETQALFSDQVNHASEGNVQFKLSDRLGKDCYVTTDQTRLKQILFNLISNALKFTEEGSVTLSCRRIDDQFLELSVADTGTGVSAESKRLIFERFSRGMDRLSIRKEGVGLGLSICKGIVHLLGGEIWVEDNQPHGTVFKFTLQDLGSSEKSPKTKVEPAPLKNDSDGSLVSLDGKVLVAENDDTNFIVIEKFLKHFEVSCVRARNGREAVRCVKNDANQIGLVLMDLSMPVMNGFDATRAIKKINPELTVVAHTAHAMQRDLDCARDAGCSDCLVKPVTLERLGEVLKRFSTTP